MRALIVEDDLEQGAALVDDMEGIGFDVDLERDADHAESRLLRAVYDVIILDIFVRGGTTLSLADWIKLRSPDTVVIMLTGSTIFARGEHTTEVWGADWLLRKPVQPAEFLSVVNHLSGRETLPL